MNQYFFNVTKEERENILDKHKTTYDGYVTEYGKGNMTPLTVVDMAKDKGGVTVNSRGEVSDNYLEVGAPLDMIADREDDVKHGTVDFDDEIENFDLGDVVPFSDSDEYEDDSFDIFSFEDDDIDEDLIEPLQEQIDKTRKMFLRFNKYN